MNGNAKDYEQYALDNMENNPALAQVYATLALACMTGGVAVTNTYIEQSINHIEQSINRAIENQWG